MSWDDCTGGVVSFKRQAAAQVPFAYEPVSGDRWAPGIETQGGQSTGADNRRPGGAPASRAQVTPRRVSDRTVRGRRLHLKACLDELERARNNSDDPILKSNSLADAKGHLEALWTLLEGNPDSAAFEEMINVLQIALCTEGLETLAPSHLDALQSVVAKMHDDPDLGDQAANDLTQELIEGGIDVFREIE
jgi:hypothetical protein